MGGREGGWSQLQQGEWTEDRLDRGWTGGVLGHEGLETRHSQGEMGWQWVVSRRVGGGGEGGGVSVTKKGC